MTYKEMRMAALATTAVIFIMCCFLLAISSSMAFPAVVWAYQFAKLFFAKDLSSDNKLR